MTRWRTERSKRFWAGVAERLKFARRQLGISEAEAAAALDITPRTYRKWERGEPHRDSQFGVFAFCEKYGVAYEWLIGGPQYRDEPPRFRLRLVS